MAGLKPKYSLTKPETKIYVGDNREILPQLRAESVDLIFADPPFNWEVPYDTWRDDMSRERYLAFTYEWLDGCVRVLAPHGSLWVNIPDDTAAETVVHLKKAGLHMINWCIWHFRFGQCRNQNFIVSKVHVLFFAKDRKNRIWNPEAVLEPSDRATTYADSRTRQTRTPGMRVPLDVWYGNYWGRIQGNNKERRNHHRNQIPEVYLERVIKACSNKGDLVLDPFLGSGTTCTVARALGRRSIGIEISPKHAKSAFERVQEDPVRLEKPFESAIKKAFFATHRGLSSDEVIMDDELRREFLKVCRDKLREVGLRRKDEFQCNWELERLRKAGKLGPITKRRRIPNRAEFDEAKTVAKRIRLEDTIDRTMCDPRLREYFDKQAQQIAPGISAYLVRKAVLGKRKNP